MNYRFVFAPGSGFSRGLLHTPSVVKLQWLSTNLSKPRKPGILDSDSIQYSPGGNILMSQIPIYVINLDEDRDRLEAITRQLDDQGLAFTRFPAFRGANIPERWQPQFEGSPIGDGEIGCYASHLQCMADMLDTDESARVILEDDAVLADNFPELLEILPDCLPDDWNIVRLYMNERRPFFVRENLPKGFDLVTYNRIPYGTVGYMIDRKFAQLFTSFYPRSMAIDLDLKYPHLFGSFQTYGISPPPVTTESRLSTIEDIGRHLHKSKAVRRKRWFKLQIWQIRTIGFWFPFRYLLRKMWRSVSAQSLPPAPDQSLPSTRSEAEGRH